MSRPPFLISQYRAFLWNNDSFGIHLNFVRIYRSGSDLLDNASLLRKMTGIVSLVALRECYPFIGPVIDQMASAVTLIY